LCATNIQRKNSIITVNTKAPIALEKVLLAVFFVLAVHYFCYATKNQICRQRILFFVLALVIKKQMQPCVVVLA
jgi:hypothetical protein